MSAREQANQYAVDHFLLADNDLSNFFSDAVELRGRKLKGGIRLHGNIILHQPGKIGRTALQESL